MRTAVSIARAIRSRVACRSIRRRASSSIARFLSAKRSPPSNRGRETLTPTPQSVSSVLGNEAPPGNPGIVIGSLPAPSSARNWVTSPESAAVGAQNDLFVEASSLSCAAMAASRPRSSTEFARPSLTMNERNTARAQGLFTDLLNRSSLVIRIGSSRPTSSVVNSSSRGLFSTRLRARSACCLRETACKTTWRCSRSRPPSDRPRQGPRSQRTGAPLPAPGWIG